MDITQAYATAAGGIIILFILANSLSHIARLIKLVYSFTSVHLTYPYLLSRHRFLGPWTRAGVLAQLIYMAANLFSLSYRVSTISQAGLRGGTLSLINMIPLFAGPHLGFLADLLGISVAAYRRLYRSAGLVSSALFLFHVLTMVGRGSLSVGIGRGLFGVIVSTHGWFGYLFTDRCREGVRSASWLYCPILSSARSPTKSSFVHTKRWRLSSSIPLGDISRRIAFSLAYISTSLLAYSRPRASSKPGACYIGTVPSATVAREP